MDKVITTALLIVISMVMSLALFSAAYPAIISGGDAIVNMTSRQEDRMKSQVSIIEAAGELDSSGQWQDVNGDGQFDAFIWVKNIGATTISAVERTDVFFGREGDYVRIPFQADAGTNYPFWTWNLENGSEWTPTTTLKITIHYQNPIAAGRYLAKVNIANGTGDEYVLGM